VPSKNAGIREPGALIRRRPAHIVWSLVIAMLAYMVLHAAIRGLLRLASRA
jgi:hypothetical protein